MKLSPKQRELASKNAALPLILDKLAEIEDRLDKLPSEDSQIEKTAVKFAAEITKMHDGTDGVDGKDGKEGIDGVDGKNGKDGRDGKDGKQGSAGPQGPAGRDGRDGIDGKNGLDGSPDTADTIRNKLELLPEGEKLAIEAIEDLRKELDALKEENARTAALPRGIGNRSSNAMKPYPLTPDGSTKTFLVPKGVAGFVLSSDFPYIYTEGAGYTINANRTQIILQQDNAPTAQSTLLYVYSSMFN